jgi:hypothetical protein
VPSAPPEATMLCPMATAVIRRRSIECGAQRTRCVPATQRAIVPIGGVSYIGNRRGVWKEPVQDAITGCQHGQGRAVHTSN